MISSYFAGRRPRILMTLLASAAIATTGCSNTTSTASLGGVTAAAKVGGRIHGGNQPVAGAAVNLYFASQSTFAAGASRVATTLSSSDGAGAFSFNKTTGAANDGTSASFSCPTTNNDNPYVFVVAKGGTTVNTPGATPNADAEFIAPMGRCSDISASTNIYMSEVVTVATMAAIHQFMNPTAAAGPIESTVGSDGIYVADLGLSRAFDNVSVMASLATGLGNASLTLPGSTAGATAVSMTVSPELAKINQLANIISSCINQTTSGSVPCTTIYSSAAFPANAGTTSVNTAQYATATDLLTALYYIFTNPTNGASGAVDGGLANRTALFSLSAASGAPYQPTLTSIPTDWSIGIKYVASGSCTNSSTNFFNSPTALTLDLNGNVLVTNSSTASNGSIAEIASNGAPLFCAPLTAGASGTTPVYAAGSAFDVNGNVWVGSASTPEIFRYTPSNATPIVIPTASPILQITTDGYGDVFFSTSSGNLYEIVKGAALTTTSAIPVPVQINLDASSAPVPLGAADRIMIDSANRIWASSGSTFITGTAGVVDQTGTFLTGFVTTSYPTATSFGISSTSAAGSGVYTSSAADNSITYLAGSGTTFSVVNGFPATGGGLNSPVDIALDGAQNVWAANSGGGLSAFSRFGTALSPSTGFQKDPSYLGGQGSIVVDTSGNIWTALSSGGTITEIVGGAVPVYQPYSNGLQPITGRFQTLP